MRLFICYFFLLISVAHNRAAFAQHQGQSADSLRLLVHQSTGTAKANALNTLARYYLQTNLDSVAQLVQQAETLSGQLHYATGKAEALLTKARWQQNKAAYYPALELALESLRLLEQEQRWSQAGLAHLVIAQIYKDMGGQTRTQQYVSKGISYSQAAYRLYKQHHDTAGLVNSLNMAGILYRDKAIGLPEPAYYDTAFSCYTRALALVNQSGKGKEYLGKLYNNISQVYSEYKKDFSTALTYLFKAVDYNKAQNNLLSLSYNYGNISQAYVKLKEPAEALTYAREMLQMAQRVQRPTRLHDAYRQLYEVFHQSGHPDSALRYYKMADAVNDSLTNVAKNKQVLDLQTQYETAKKELAIQQLNEESSEKSRRIWLLGGALVAFALVMMALIVLFRRVQKQKKLLAEQSARLEVMMKELHHRVKNNLQIVSSLLSLQTYKLKDAETRGVLLESQQRVQAMSLIHQRLYKKDELTTINLKEYITDLLESLLSSYGYQRDNFDLRIEMETEMLDIDKALPIGLILNELVTNSFKYAYEGISHPLLHIAVRNQGDGLLLTVKDNGKGLPETAWKSSGTSFGKQLVSALCRQLRAQQTVSSSNGTEFNIIIPLAA